MQTVSFEKFSSGRPTIYRLFYCGALCGFLFKKHKDWKYISFANWASPIREFKTLKEAKHYVRSWFDRNGLFSYALR